MKKKFPREDKNLLSYMVILRKTLCFQHLSVIYESMHWNPFRIHMISNWPVHVNKFLGTFFFKTNVLASLSTVFRCLL